MTTVLDWACPGNLKVLETLDVVGGFAGAVSFSQLRASNVTNQIELGVGNTTIINSLAPAADRIYTLLDAGANANLVLTEGTYLFNGNITFTRFIGTGNSNVYIQGGSVGIRNVSVNALGGGATNDNVAVGANALGSIGTVNSFSNVAVGVLCATALLSGTNNVFLGYQLGATGTTLSTGNNNVLVGANTAENILAGDNNICILSKEIIPGAIYNNCIAFGQNFGFLGFNNSIHMGDSNITNADIEVAWFVTSDKNKKKQIEDITLGLDFINKLTPKKYLLKSDADNETKKRYGFIAQEIEETLTLLGVTDFGGLDYRNEKYSLRYDDLFACLVKAIQELLSIYMKK